MRVGDVVSEIENLSYQRNDDAITSDTFSFRIEDDREIPARSYKAYDVTVQSIIDYERNVVNTFFKAV